jgi:Tol biopolymer transport system component
MSAAVKLLRLDQTLWLWDWSPDGKTLVYSTNRDLWLLPLEGEPKPVQVSKTPGDDQYAQFSPDGKWLAYSSGPLDHTEVFVQPLSATGAYWQISQGGGDMPRWRRDGRELFYRARDGMLTAVSYSTTTGAFETTARTTLFAVASLGNVERFTYQPSRDGQRFLINAPVAGAAPPVTIVLNWQAGLRK